MPGHFVYGLTLHASGRSFGISASRPTPSRCYQNLASRGASLPPESLHPNCRSQASTTCASASSPELQNLT